MSEKIIRSHCKQAQRGPWRWLQNTLLAALLIGLTACAAVTEQTPAEVPDKQSQGDKTIALLGATGLVGGYLLDEALQRGYTVTALARSPHKLAAYRERITIVQGNALDPAVLEQLLTGADIVLNALGPVRTDGDASQMLNSTVTGHLLPLLEKHNIERYMVVSGAAVDVPGDGGSISHTLLEAMVALTLADALRDKQAEYAMLAASTAPWTLIRCPVIRDETYAREPKTSLDSPSGLSVRAGELAHFIVDELAIAQYIGRAPFINSR